MAINFPNSPQLNDTYQVGSDTWIWNGQTWEVLPVSSPTFEALTVTDVIDGQVNDISNHSLGALGNVSDATPADGALLVYDALAGTWSGQFLAGGFNGGTITGTLFVSNSTASTNTTSGALRVTGGLGIGGAVYAGGSVTAVGITSSEPITVQGSRSLRLADSDSSNYVGFKAPGSVAASLVWTLPATDGTSGQFLRTNGAGVLSWADAEGGSGGGGSTIGGASGQVQFNNEGLFDGNAGLTFNADTSLLTASKLLVSDSTNSTSTTTGAAVVSGGAGIGGSVFVGGSVSVAGNVTISTSPTAATHAATKSYVDSNALAFSIAFGV